MREKTSTVWRSPKRREMQTSLTLVVLFGVAFCNVALALPLEDSLGEELYEDQSDVILDSETEKIQEPKPLDSRHKFTLKDALKEVDDAIFHIEADEVDEPDKMDVACCQMFKERGGCEKALALEVCLRTCRCVDQISSRSCHILKAKDHCDEKNIALVCRETCGVCGRKPTGKSCLEIKKKFSSARDGVYEINPTGAKDEEFKAYCDMTTDGGGWTMCYTTDDKVSPRTETTYNPTLPYGTNGYRTDCNNIKFTDILYVDEKSKQTAFFKRDAEGALLVSANYGDKSKNNGMFNANGVANTSRKYQLLICDTSFYRGFFVSGYTGCYKQCNNWCGDGGSAYFRTASTSSSYNGVAFNVNGHRPQANRLMSVGLR